MCACQSAHFQFFFCLFFFFNDTATTEIYTLSLHDALPISHGLWVADVQMLPADAAVPIPGHLLDRKSTRLNSSHTVISYAVFCLKKKTANEVSTYNISYYYQFSVNFS